MLSTFARVSLGAAVVGAALTFGAPSAFPASPSATGSPCRPPQCESGALDVDGESVAYDVVLPPGYATSGRSYPVLYLLHGGLMDQNAWLSGGETGLSTSVFGTGGDIEQFLDALPSGEQAIVVLPSSPGIGAWMDWANGDHEYQQALVDHLIPYVDAHFRTIPGRAERAIAGLSAGGYGALLTAARHPDMFTAVGSFSGLDDIASPQVELALVGAGSGVSAICAIARDNPVSACASNASIADVTGLGPLGSPLTNQVLYHADNPGDLADNFPGMSIWLASGSGVPCNATDAADPGAEALEIGLIRPSMATFDADLTRNGVVHTSVFRPCGVHRWPYWDADLAQWWPIMLRAFGSGVPAEFDYRSTAPSFSVWNWSFQADPKRAQEFLDVVGAGPSGFTLTGSGLTTVVTGPLFAAGETVELHGATTPNAVADAAGRIVLQVDLGTAHTAQQYTTASLLARAAAASLGQRYMTTRSVTMVPVSGASGH